MTRSRWIIFTIIVLATLGGLVALSGKDKVDVSNVDPNVIVTEGDGKDQVYGNPDAKVIVIEYADFQCPGCASAYENVNEIKELYKDEVAFVFRHFPLTSIHPNALAASAVAEAAGKQGKFWEMHDILFANQTNWKDLRAENRGAIFAGYATELELNIDQFNSDLGSKTVSNKIAQDRAVGSKAGVSSTPTFFLNGEKASDDVTLDLIQNNGDEFKKSIEAAIKSAGGTVPPKTTEE